MIRFESQLDLKDCYTGDQFYSQWWRFALTLRGFEKETYTFIFNGVVFTKYGEIAVTKVFMVVLQLFYLVFW